MHVTESLGERLERSGLESIFSYREREPARVKAFQPLSRQVEEEWPRLPYAMMQVTAAARPRDGRRFYWRDQSVQWGDIELNLFRRRTKDTPTYTAIYSRGDYSQRNSRNNFLVPLHPSLEDEQLRWNAPSICDSTNLTSRELVEVLLAKLVSLGAGVSPNGETGQRAGDGCGEAQRFG